MAVGALDLDLRKVSTCDEPITVDISGGVAVLAHHPLSGVDVHLQGKVMLGMQSKLPAATLGER